MSDLGHLLVAFVAAYAILCFIIGHWTTIQWLNKNSEPFWECLFVWYSMRRQLFDTEEEAREYWREPR